MIWSSAVSTFLASVVEFVEALTIVLVVGATINWRTALWGAAAAALTLAALVAVFGTALVQFVPIETLRLIVGVILILFGMKWLKKSILRYSGLKALHDEEAIYEEEMRALQARGEALPNKINGFGFATSYKSVLLEGLEVAFIVISVGSSSAANNVDKGGTLLSAALGATLAGILVIGAGVAIRGPLTRVPENTLKFVVGIMLTSFGIFWGGEGLGIEWPGKDLFLLALIAANLLMSGALVAWLRPQGQARKASQPVKAATFASEVAADQRDPVWPLRKEELQ